MTQLCVNSKGTDQSAQSDQPICSLLLRQHDNSGPEIIKLFFMINSAEHEVKTVHEYSNSQNL